MNDGQQADVLASIGRHRGWIMAFGLAVLGVLSLIIGLYAARHVLVTLLALALLLGIFWIVNGSVELFMALSRHIAAGGGAQRLAPFLRGNEDHPGVPAPVPRPPGQNPSCPCRLRE